MIIREATDRDVTAIAALHVESWRSAYRGILSDDYLDHHADHERLRAWREKFSARDRKPMFVLLADLGAEIAGFACVFPEEDGVFGSFVDNLHVAPHLTGRGIGRLLLSEAARRLLANGSRSGLYLWVVDQNHRARRFYERAGGALVGSEAREAVDGRTVVIFRYHWPDLVTLLL